MFDLLVKGKSSHAGSQPKEGVSAIEELAQQILKLHGMTNYQKGNTVNVGVVNGGTQSNVIAGEAYAEVDVRITKASEVDNIINSIQKLQPIMSETELEIQGGLNRPPMERTFAIKKLFHHAKHLADELGIELAEESSGGGSDGNFTAALEIPTLDGLGSVGQGEHSKNELIYINYLPERTALLTRLFETL
ncbi:M20/M25/M40 family metallo-hydrolase [Natranaerobius thermophilus]|uniref:M20/M25/M40 family metallo-hydrolase n=1 Tax=Natranaerobius thermophilus TaxID=375929 RepID=UPI000166A95C|nr:M20/M25/M40 family metallo-hydrolase [Natranaerobius thermophilus]